MTVKDTPAPSRTKRKSLVVRLTLACSRILSIRTHIEGLVKNYCKYLILCKELQ